MTRCTSLFGSSPKCDASSCGALAAGPVSPRTSSMTASNSCKMAAMPSRVASFCAWYAG
jgi:hypothetical protein